MINYAYPTLFLTEGTQKDLLITDGTITVVGTEYTVSDETVLFTNSDLEEEAFELSQSLCSEMQLTFGCCETAKMTFTVRKSYNTNIVGTVVNLYIIPNHDASKMLQLGVFKIYEDKKSDSHDQHFITAYDAMYEILNADVSEWYDTLLPNKASVVKLSVFRTSFLSHFGLSYGGILPNDSLDIRRTIEVRNADGDLEPLSGATIIKAICELNSVFGVIVNTGAFRFRRLIATLETSNSLYEIPVSNYIDVQEGEYSLPIKKVIIRTGKSTVQKTEPTVDPYNTYVVVGNPLISDYTRAEATAALGVLANSAFKHGYSAFSINALGNPLVEVGDGVKITKPNGDYIYSYVFERRWSGIQALRDTYSANASEYLSEDLNTSYTKNKEIENQISQISQSVVNVDVDFVETIRNIGFRLLDEPSNVSIEYEETISSDDWELKTWNGLSNIVREDIWTDGTNIYYSHGTSSLQYVLNTATDTWESKTWLGDYYPAWGHLIWTDGEDCYYSNGVTAQYKLNKSTGRWETIILINGNNFIGTEIWCDGEYAYRSSGTSQYVLNKSTNTWDAITWNGLSQNKLNAYGIWTDGEHIYYSSNGTHLVLNRTTRTWSNKTWYGATPTASRIWTDGTEVYLSAGTDQYVLNKSTSTWTTKTWTGLTNFYGSYVWRDNGGRVFYSSGTTQYSLSQTTQLKVSIKWTDPSDISTNEPCPATWAGTVVVRKEGSAPRHRWDGTLIVDSTTRDQYSSTALEDNTVDAGKTYYYGIFPYDTNGYYRFTKVVSVTTVAAS